MAKKLIIAHRGASKLAHENTLEAFQKAIDLGADMIELDLRKTNDGEIVVSHDELLRARLIRKINYKTALLLAKKTGYEMPTLEQVLKLTAGKIKLDIELKESGYEDQIINLALRYFEPEDFIISSFLTPSVIFTKNNYPQIKSGLLLEPWLWTVFYALRYLDWSYFRGSLTNRSQAIEKSDFLGLNKIISPASIKPFKNLFVFTINSPKSIKDYLSEKRISGIITDCPELAKNIQNQAYAP